MSKFKEYWLFKGDETELRVYEEKISGADEHITHVIEYQAYEEVLAELAGIRNQAEVKMLEEEQMLDDLEKSYYDNFDDDRNYEEKE